MKKTTALHMGAAVAAAVLGFCGAASATTPAQDIKGDNTLSNVLAQKAYYWQANGRADLAAQNWRMVLRLSPDKTEALAYLALYNINKGNTAKARQYLGRIRRMAPGSPSAALIARAIATEPGALSSLRKAGKMARDGKNFQALKLYGQIFGNKVPPMPYAATYYQLMAKTPDGLHRAISELGAFVGNHPGDYAYKLLRARLMARQGSTRQKAFDAYQKLANRPGMRPVVRPFWRQAIQWDSANPHVVDAIRNYTRVYPLSRWPDSGLLAIEKKAKTSSQVGGPQESPLVKKGFVLLHNHRPQAAAKMFAQRLSENSADRLAMVGLASAEMKADQYGEAARWLRRAHDVPGARRLLRQATFWQDIQRAKQAISSHGAKTANAALRAAESHSSGTSAEIAALADVQSRAGHYRVAERAWRRILRSDPNSVRAWSGLLETARRSGDRLKIDEIKQGMPLSVLRRIRANPGYVSTSAAAMAQKGRDGEAASLLGAFLSAHHGRHIGMRLQRAWYLYRDGQDQKLYDSLHALDKMALSPAQARQAESVYVAAATREAKRALESGQRNVAVDIMGRVTKHYPHSASAQRAMANTWLEAGYPGRAYSLFKKVGPGGGAGGYDAAIGSAIGARRWAIAQHWAREAAHKWPSDPTISALYAEAAQGAGAVRMARAQWQKTLRLTRPGSTLANNRDRHYAFLGTPAHHGPPAAVPDVRKLASLHERAQTALSTSLRLVHPHVNTFVRFHNTSGSQGFDAEHRVSMGASYTREVAGHTLRVTASDVIVGNNAATGPSHALWKFGTRAIEPYRHGAVASSDQSGVSAMASLSGRHWGLSVGHTPMAFHASHFVGSFWIHPTATPFKLSFSRKAVKQSVLSYAGLRNRITGKTWGGAVDNAVTLSVGKKLGTHTQIHASMNVGVITGTNIRRNEHLGAEAGIRWVRPNIIDGQTLRYGVDVSAMAYRHNDSHYTWGSGGYFSPQRYLSMVAPFSLGGKLGRHGHYALNARLGYHAYHYGGVEYFPTRPDLEEASGNLLFAGKSVSGLFYGMGASLDYHITPHLSAGVSANITDEKGFRSEDVMAHVKYRFGKAAPQGAEIDRGP